MNNKGTDLRSALALLETMPGQLIETDVEVDPMAELAGVYRHVGAGGTVMRPTKEGPARRWPSACWPAASGWPPCWTATPANWAK